MLNIFFDFWAYRKPLVYEKCIFQDDINIYILADCLVVQNNWTNIVTSWILNEWLIITIIDMLHMRRSAEFQEAEINPKRFDYNDLRIATRNFHEDMKLGAGGYGAVYKVND